MRILSPILQRRKVRLLEIQILGQSHSLVHVLFRSLCFFSLTTPRWDHRHWNICNEPGTVQPSPVVIRHRLPSGVDKKTCQPPSACVHEDIHVRLCFTNRSKFVLWPAWEYVRNKWTDPGILPEIQALQRFQPWKSQPGLWTIAGALTNATLIFPAWLTPDHSGMNLTQPSCCRNGFLLRG